MVNNSDTKVSYQGNGQTTVFPFSFPFIQRDYIKVAIYDSLTDETKTIDSDYYVDTVANAVIYPGYEPGQEPAEALRPPILPATSTITIYRQTDVDQLTNLGEKYPLKDIENMADKLTEIIQEQAETLGRTVKVPVGDPKTPEEKLTDLQNYVSDAANSAKNAATSEASAQRSAEAAATSEANAAESERLAGGYADTATAAASRAEDSAISARAYNAPDYDNTVTYQAGEVVTYTDGNSYRALQETTGNEPTNIIYWQKVTDYVGDDFFEVDEYGYIVPMDSPSHSRYWRVDQNGYIVPIEGGDGGYRPDTRSLSSEYLNVTNEGYVKHLRADDIAAQEVDADEMTAEAAAFNALTANAVNAGTVTANDIIAKGPVVDVRAFGAKGDGVTDDTAAFEAAISAAENNTLFIPNGNYKINSTLIANKAKSVVNNGAYTGVEPIYPVGDNLSKMALNLTPEIQINYPSAAEPTSTVSYYCQSVGYNPVTDHVLLVFAGYTIATGANDQPGKVVEMTADYQTVINSATVDVGHGNGCCYCSKDAKWYIATGTGIISLNSDLSLNSTHLTGSGWTVEYSEDKDVFYVQVGATGIEYNGKVNIYSYDWELLSQTTLERVKNRYKTDYLTSQDATLINGDYVFLYYGAQDISLTTYDMLTGKIKEQAVFDNVTGREAEGVYVRQNQVYIVSVTGSNLLIYKCLLNNVANISPYRLYAPGEEIGYANLLTGYFTNNGTELWFNIQNIPVMQGKNFVIDFTKPCDFIVRQNGNYIINNSSAVLSGYKVKANLNPDYGLGVSHTIIMAKTDDSAFDNAINNGSCAIYLGVKLTVV